MGNRLQHEPISGEDRTITSCEELRQLTQESMFLESRPVRLALAGLENSASEKLENRLNRYLLACGCTEGKILSLLALAAYIAFLVANDEGPKGWMAFVLGFLATGIAGIAGKIAGLLRARRQIRKVILEVCSTVDADSRTT